MYLSYNTDECQSNYAEYKKTDADSTNLFEYILENVKKFIMRDSKSVVVWGMVRLEEGRKKGTISQIRKSLLCVNTVTVFIVIIALVSQVSLFLLLLPVFTFTLFLFLFFFLLFFSSKNFFHETCPVCLDSTLGASTCSLTQIENKDTAN